ncbi:MAG: hypothetical protein R3320_04575 [Nitriliruptorales bacterium]|nr:hypothetical protein [Nitriliruptorales bacterium]
MGRHLIVANQTLGGAELDDKIRDRIDSGGRFYVVVPMIEPENEASWIPSDPAFGMPAVQDLQQEAQDEARTRSEHRLARMLDRIESLGGEADGEVGASDPYVAVKDVLERERFDEIIVSTLPAGISRWLKMDLPSRVDRLTERPVTTVEASEADAGS